MLPINDFVDLDAAHFKESIDRRVRAQQALAESPPEERLRLAHELLKIVSNPGEVHGRKLHAASTLWHSANLLGIMGSASIAQTLATVLEREFLPSAVPGRSNAEVCVPLDRLWGTRYTFFTCLSSAIINIDRKFGAQFCLKLARIAGDSTCGAFLVRLTRTYTEEALRRTRRH
jgi:hypothetical protein